MDKKFSKRRLAENEVLFRQRNEQATKGLDALKQSALADGHPQIAQIVDHDRTIPLHFYCECSDETCRQRIILTSEKYEELHQNSSQFVVLPGHHVPEVERVVSYTPKYEVVEKYKTPPSSVDHLNPTPIDHT